MKKPLAVAVALAALAVPAWAETKTVTLSVPGMDCAACPITIKKALGKVPGVSKVEASFEKKQAVVTFDDSKANVALLTRATAEAGFPSTAK
jgi:mercuric ion binding protein